MSDAHGRALEDAIDLALAMGEPERAEKLLLGAGSLAESSPALQFLHGELLLCTGRIGEAIARLSDAIRLDPASVDARLAMARACQAQGDLGYAAWWLRDACQAAPGNTQVWLQLIQWLREHDRQAELAQTLRQASAANPRSQVLLEQLAEHHLLRHELQEALAVCEALLVLDPHDVRALVHCGFCHEGLYRRSDLALHSRRLELAADCYRRALQVDADDVQAHTYLGGLLWRLGDFAGSLAHARRALEIAPDDVHAQRVFGTALFNGGHLDDARVAFRRLLSVAPDFAHASMELGLLELLTLNFEDGWRLHAERWKDGRRRPPHFRADLAWEGPAIHPLAGKHIVVFGEQGLGDELQFVRYAGLLREQGATVHCIARPELAPLLRGMPDMHCIADPSTVEADHHVVLMDLPLRLGTTAGSLPARTPYLRADSERVAFWRERLAPWHGRLKVGLAWAGNFAHTNQFNRSMPLSTLLPLLSQTGVQCFSLQKSPAGRFGDATVEAARLVDFTGEWTDFADSAAMVENLDLVIGVDSAVIHLAGALGKPAWLMLPPNPDWRWGLAGETSYWYPTLRLFRRGHGEPREAQVARIVDALAAFRLG